MVRLTARGSAAARLWQNFAWLTRAIAASKRAYTLRAQRGQVQSLLCRHFMDRLCTRLLKFLGLSSALASPSLHKLAQPRDARRLCSMAGNGEVTDDPKRSGGRLRGVCLVVNVVLIEQKALV